MRDIGEVRQIVRVQSQKAQIIKKFRVREGEMMMGAERGRMRFEDRRRESYPGDTKVAHLRAFRKKQPC